MILKEVNNKELRTNIDCSEELDYFTKVGHGCYDDSSGIGEIFFYLFLIVICYFLFYFIPKRVIKKVKEKKEEKEENNKDIDRS